MASLLDGLKLYEILLMFLGLVLFLALVFILVYKVVKGGSLKGLIMFFLLPIVMIGYPSIKSIAWSDFKLELKEQTNIVQANPSDSAAYKKLTESLQQVDYDRIESDPSALKDVASAHSAVGDYDKALVYIDKSIKLDSNKESSDVRKKIEEDLRIKKDFDSKISKLNEIIMTTDNNSTAKANEAAKVLTEITPPVFIDKEASLTLAKALSVVDENKKAIETVNKVAEIHPDSKEVVKLQEEIVKDSVDKKEAFVVVSPALHYDLKKSEVLNAPANKLVLRRAFAKQ